MKQRSLLLFENSIRSQETLEIYRWYLKKFKEFFKLRDYDSMAHMEQKQIQILVEDYVMDLKKRANPNSVPCYVYPLKSFFEANDIDLRWKKIVKLFRSISGCAPTSENVFVMSLTVLADTTGQCETRSARDPA